MLLVVLRGTTVASSKVVLLTLTPSWPPRMARIVSTTRSAAWNRPLISDGSDPLWYDESHLVPPKYASVPRSHDLLESSNLVFAVNQPYILWHLDVWK